MKFLQLRAALEKVLAKPKAMTDPLPEPEPLPRAFFSPFPTRQKVITDRIARDPVNRQAAIVTSKTPEWARLNESKNKEPVLPRNPVAVLGDGKKPRVRRHRVHRPERFIESSGTHAKALEEAQASQKAISEKANPEPRINSTPILTRKQALELL